jgi:catechol 2,3-dioxygenase-like lactoylglutathione lyase family enzyme
MGNLEAAAPITFIITRSRDKARSFYEGVLGICFRHRDDFADVYDLAGTPLRITEVPAHQPMPHPVLGWQVNDIAETVAALTEAGVPFTIYPGMGQDDLGIWTSPDGSAKVAFFPDPDGNLLSLTQV